MKGNFASFLAPLTQDNFKQAVAEVERQLRVVHQTLGMLEGGVDGVFDEMLEAIRGKVGELLSADRTTIFLRDAERHQLWTTVQGEDGQNVEIRIPIAPTCIAGEVAVSKQSLNLPYDFFDDPRSGEAKKQFERTGYRTYTMLAVPLLDDEGDLVAVVQTINKLDARADPHLPLADRVDRAGFTDGDLALFAEFAPCLRLILESSRSFYLAAQKQRAAHALMQASLSLGQSLDLATTLRRVMDEAKQLMQADRGTLWLLDRDRGDLWTQITLPDGSQRELRVPVGVGFAGRVAATGQTMNIPFDLYDHPASDNAKKVDRDTHYRTCSLLCMPVFNSDRELIGVTQLVNKRQPGDFPPYDPADWPQAPELFRASFNDTDEQFMEAFNIQAGIAIENAKLFAKVQQEQQKQQDILRSLSDAAIATDCQGRIEMANERAYELLGWDRDRESLEGKHVVDVVQFKGDPFAQWVQASITLPDDKSRQQYYPDRLLLSQRGGGNTPSEHAVNLTINTMFDAEDPRKVMGTLVVMEDISEEKRLKTTMYRYMTQEVAEQLLASGKTDLGGERKEITVLFSDIRGYTSLTERMEAEAVVALLNEYFEVMVDAVFQHQGTLDKYMGDAMMAVFGSPLHLEDHAWKAVQTAIAMRERLVDFNQRRYRLFCDRHGHPPQTPDDIALTTLNVGIGINTDVAISGNIGSSKRMEFTAIGDGINLGARLESATKYYGCDIIISESTYRACGDRLWVRELDRIRVKGKRHPIAIYEPIDLRSRPLSPRQEAIVAHYQQGREHYHNRRFALAMGEFGQVLEADKQNRAALLHLERCQHWLQHPPPDDWDGVWTMTEK